MDSQGEGRSGTGWLAGLTVVALLAGVGWWTATEPDTTPGSAMAPRADLAIRAATGPAASVVRTQSPPGDRVSMVDPATGRIGASGSQVMIDPSTGRVVGVGTPAPGQSRVGTVVWRENRLLTDNVREWRRHAAGVPGTRYQLLVLCYGGGDLLVWMGGGGRGNGRRANACDGTLHSIGVTGTGDVISVLIRHRQEGAVDLAAMLVALD